MDFQQVQDIRLMYEAVYNHELREKAEEYNNTVYDEDIVEVATEYFYTYGLNSDGVDILIEKVGLDNFVEFVYGLSEDLVVLTEARPAKKRRPGGPSYDEVMAKINEREAAAKEKREAKKEARKKASVAAQERTETEKKEPESRGADTEAKAEQPKTKKPVRDAIARNIFRAVDAYKAGMERHKSATATAGRLAKETGKTLGKVVSTTHEAGRRAGEHVKKHGLKSLANEEFEYWVNSLIEEGYDLSEYTWDDMYEIYLDEASRGLPESFDNFDIILEYLVAEGYADTNQSALVIMANMSEEWKQSIVEGRVASETMSSDERRRARNNEYRQNNPTLPSGNPMGPNAQLMRQREHAKNRGVKKRK
jgi:hypothetical protein